MAVMFAEFLDHRGRVIRRARIDGFPATLGRARTNDVIIDDPKVCPQHAELVTMDDRGVVLRDLDSINGTRRTGYDQRVTELAVKSGTRFRMGDTTIRLLTPDHPVAATQIDRVSGIERLLPVRARGPALVGTAVLLIPLAIVQAMSATWEAPATEALLSVMAFLSVGVVWAGFWTLVNRLVARRYRFAEHLFWGMLIGPVASTNVAVPSLRYSRLRIGSANTRSRWPSLSTSPTTTSAGSSKSRGRRPAVASAKKPPPAFR